MKKNFLNIFSYKIKTKTELHKILKKKTNKKILCHGNFDVVHPGHIRHLLYAKSKADILVVSITPDKFIKKGIYRPHIPQNLRALNLAALEFIDYVIIDNYVLIYHYMHYYLYKINKIILQLIKLQLNLISFFIIFY